MSLTGVATPWDAFAVNSHNLHALPISQTQFILMKRGGWSTQMNTSGHSNPPLFVLLGLLHFWLQDVVETVGNGGHALQLRITLSSVIVELDHLVKAGVLDDQLDCGS